MSAPEWLKKLSQITSDIEQWKACIIEDKKETNKNFLFVLGQLASHKGTIERLEHEVKMLWIAVIIFFIANFVFLVITVHNLRGQPVDGSMSENKSRTEQVQR